MRSAMCATPLAHSFDPPTCPPAPAQPTPTQPNKTSHAPPNRPTPPSQLSIRHKPHSLPNPQIHQHLLGPPQNRIKLIRPMEHLNLRPHPAHRQPPPPKNIRRLIRNLMRGPRRKRLQQPDRTRQQHGLLRVRHAVHLVREGLEPGLVGFDEGDEAGEFVPD